MSLTKFGFLALLLLHGAIHLLGFVKAYHLVEVPQLSHPIGKSLGWLWLITSLLFIITAFIFWMNKEWFLWSIIAVLLSQLLIVLTWSDAKMGTLANILILGVAIFAFFGHRFKQSFLQDATLSIARSLSSPMETVENDDIAHLPLPVQKYLQYVQVIGKPKPRNMKVTMSGKMRGKDQDWFDFKSIQYSTFDKLDRLFFMNAVVKKLPTSGYHYFKEETARMDIKLLSLFPVVTESGELLRKAETVTLFNDMCIMAPAALINNNIRWEDVNEHQVLAHFTNEGITISARLFFNDDGALVNFYSDDRIDINDKEAYGFSTPVYQSTEKNGYKLPAYGEAIWHYPDGEFIYGNFDIESIIYNIKGVEE